jgi:hypothetical protein
VHIKITIYIDYSYESVGSALVQLERSTLQEHNGTRTVVLRFLKIITPVECVIPLYDGYIHCPKEGELYRRGLKSQAWSVNLDRDKLKSVKLDRTKLALLRGLQLLWDT